MKTIAQLRDQLDFYPQEISSSVKYFRKNNIDWDVHLESIGKNLQRDFVWSIEQKRELINSILIGRHIPHCAVINTIDKNDDHKDLYLIIDGKQRLSTMFDFVDDKFTFVIDDTEYLFSELPADYQQAIMHYHFRYYVVNEPWEKRITDEQKITWFKFINFAGTPQDKEHLDSLK
jgi:uncharacterized protein with ParB-like and HNH nuclease domain